jgi:hypothetical protein
MVWNSWRSNETERSYRLELIAAVRIEEDGQSGWTLRARDIN